MKTEILTCARMAQHGGVLDKVIQEGHFLNIIKQFDFPNIERYLDVSISEIYALDRSDLLKPGVTWRNSVNKLLCNGWEQVREEIVEYFTSELYEKTFPTPGSKNPLKIDFVGGAPYCVVGNHRLIAGKAWLAFNVGEEAVLNKAKCTYHPVKPKIKAILQSCLNKGDTLKYYHLPYSNLLGRYDYFIKKGYRNFLRVDSKSDKSKLYVFGEYLDRKNIPYSRPYLPRFLMCDMYSMCINFNYRVIPNFLIEQILDESKVINAFNLSEV